MKLARHQRTRLFAGDTSPLTFEAKPTCKVGDRYVISWSQPKPTFDAETGKVVEYDKEPTLWITVTRVVRRARGGWTVRFDIVDRRQPRRLLRGVPPFSDPERARQDELMPPTADETRDAAEESAYTANPGSSIDHLDAVPAGYSHPDAATLQRRQQAVLAEATRSRLSLGGQLDSLLQDARDRRADVRNRANKIEREIELLKKDLERRAA